MPSSFSEKGEFEQSLARSGSIAGVDEVGRGCLAGPVYAGAVQLCYDSLNKLEQRSKLLIRDSKTLSKRQRQLVVGVLADVTLSSATASSSVREIEELGIVGATFLAMRRAISALAAIPGLVLVDGNREIEGYSHPQRAIIRGDSLCYAISAASILAKEARDQFMAEQAVDYPNYGFADHVGYGTRMHLASIREFGICPLHRRNFSPISSYCQ